MDYLIRDLISTGRDAKPDEVRAIIERMATAPFNQQVVRVPVARRGRIYQGRTLGNREVSAFLHLVQRVVSDRQWADGATLDEYLEDLHTVIRFPEARLVVYQMPRGPVAATISTNRLPASHLGPEHEALVFVVYSPDRSAIITGYQASGIETLTIPDGAQWLT